MDACFGSGPRDVIDLNVQFIYYQTSELEELDRWQDRRADYEGVTDADEDDVTPDFSDDETEDGDPLVLRASGDGNTPHQNLHLKEVGRFSGKYEGFLRLTDADGDGSIRRP